MNKNLVRAAIAAVLLALGPILCALIPSTPGASLCAMAARGVASALSVPLDSSPGDAGVVYVVRPPPPPLECQPGFSPARRSDIKGKFCCPNERLLSTGHCLPPTEDGGR